MTLLEQLQKNEMIRALNIPSVQSTGDFLDRRVFVQLTEHNRGVVFVADQVTHEPDGVYLHVIGACQFVYETLGDDDQPFVSQKKKLGGVDLDSLDDTTEGPVVRITEKNKEQYGIPTGNLEHLADVALNNPDELTDSHGVSQYHGLGWVIKPSRPHPPDLPVTNVAFIVDYAN